jgi:hypothetical protein
MGGPFTFHHHAIFLGGPSRLLPYVCVNHLLQMSLDVNRSCSSEVLASFVRKGGNCQWMERQ